MHGLCFDFWTPVLTRDLPLTHARSMQEQTDVVCMRSGPLVVEPICPPKTVCSPSCFLLLASSIFPSSFLLPLDFLPLSPSLWPTGSLNDSDQMNESIE